MKRALAGLGCILLAACGDSESAALDADTPLHLEEHLEAAIITGGEVTADIPAAVEWRFDRRQPDWKRAYPFRFDVEPATLQQAPEALRLVFDGEPDGDGDLVAGLYVDLPGWHPGDWASIAVTLRAEPGVRGVGLGFNLSEPSRNGTIQFEGQWVPLMSDGTTRTYLLDVANRPAEIEGSWDQLVLWFWGPQARSLDLLSVSAIPKLAIYSAAGAGTTTEVRDSIHRQALYAHAPSELRYRVRVPERGRLDVGLGTVSDDAPIDFAVTVTAEGDSTALLRESVTESAGWRQRSVDLSAFAGRVITLSLETTAANPGVALWATPTVSGGQRGDRPNVILYVIDGAGADSMSLYGYNRRTTPFLERLAAEGAVFEYAYSNSSWTRPSTPSFLTSLHHSVLGGQRNGQNSPPEQVLTAAEHLKRAGYQTALLTTNPNAGAMSHLDRGVDFFRETGPDTASSQVLHADFWQWRSAYPSEPYWAHFQTTDVHSPNVVVPPFAGLFVSPERRATYRQWQEQVDRFGGGYPYSDAFARTGIDRLEYFDVARGLYDETMARQDYQLGRFVDRLKETGEWENTLLIVASDHGHAAGSAHFGLGLLDPQPPVWEGALLSSFQTRIPLMFIWPGQIAGGLRFRDPVSMIDLLPTVLDLLDLPEPEIAQGQSLAPLLLGQDGWEPRPVILDEFLVDGGGSFRGWIEMIDGRWGASLLIGPSLEPGQPFLSGLFPGYDDELFLRGHRERPAPGSVAWSQVPERIPRLLLYDLWEDRTALSNVNDRYPDLVDHYARALEALWASHRQLAGQFSWSESPAMTAEQLETLRRLGYIR